MNPTNTVAVVGGGAGGLMAAISCKEQNPALNVVVLERMDKVGKKILATGNGQCNLSNQKQAQDFYHSQQPDFIKPALEAFSLAHTLAFFERLGLMFHISESGKIYPKSLQASAVLDVLRLRLTQLNIQEKCGFQVSRIQKNKTGYQVISENKEWVFCKKVIVAAGGQASAHLGSDGSGYALLEALGHRRTNLFPSLVQIKTQTEEIRALSGIKVNALAAAVLFSKSYKTESGEVLFTDYGLSGPCIFQLSRVFGEYFSTHPNGQDAAVVLDFLPEYTRGECYELIKSRTESQSDKLLQDFFTGIFHKRVGQIILKKAAAGKMTKAAGTLTQDEICAITHMVKAFEIPVRGSMPFKNAQVTVGGMDTRDFNPHTLESKKAPGIYACAEILDVDGDCGGYNLQWAWSSGFLAGSSCAKSMGKEAGIC